MNRGRLTDEALVSGLEARLPGAPGELLESVIGELETTPQQRAFPSFLGRLTDADPVARRRATLLAAAMLILASLAIGLASGAVDRAAPLPGPVQLTEVDQPLEYQTYGLGDFPVDIRVSGMEGWLGSAGSAIGGMSYDIGGDREALLTFWVVGFVYEDACPERSPAVPQQSVDAIADALEGLPEFEILDRRFTVLDGYPTRYIEMNSPTNPACDNFALWRTPRSLGFDCRCLANSSQHLRLWVLEVDGVRLIIDATDSPASLNNPGTPTFVKGELLAMIESIDIRSAQEASRATPAG